jgi:sarcosine oxidase
VIVVGAGAFGVWTALHLRMLGAEVTLVDAWGPGNARSSSGGETRVIRAVYGTDRVYAEMVKQSFGAWLALSETSSEPLYVETGALWLHPEDDAYVRSSMPVLRALEFPLEQLELSEARWRYPQMQFDDVQSVWLEHRAGVLSARRACAVVRDEVQSAGGTYTTGSAMPIRDAGTSLPSVALETGERLEADAFVFACGPWLGQLFPDVIGEFIRPSRQEVFYFGTPRGSSRYLPQALPVWMDFGERVIYGMPDTHNRGVKIADDTRGETVDPSQLHRLASSEGAVNARRFLGRRFPELADAPLVHSEVCQYENSPDGNLLLDRHPSLRNVWLAGGGSGHGFKLSPAVGALLARAIVNDEDLPAAFRLDRPMGDSSTQFERRE